MPPRERRELLRFVRRTAECILRDEPAPRPPEALRTLPHSGAFVTFHHGAQLRGCMGRLRSEGPFDDMLVDITDSSLHDPRFEHQPIRLGELPALEIEVSVLEPLRVVTDPGDIVLGRDGVVITRGPYSGCFLPQVASERGWDVTVFLSECCRLKAGLPPDAWRDPGTRIEAFAAEVIRERDLGPDGGNEAGGSPAQDSTPSS